MINLSWEQVNKSVQIIADAMGDVDYIYGITRGGLIPAVLLSHKKQIPLITNIDSLPTGATVLVVDDIVDSGRTLVKLKESTEYLRHYYNINFTYSALVVRKEQVGLLDIKPMVVDSEDWIKFPWETEESSVEIPASWTNGE